MSQTAPPRREAAPDRSSTSSKIWLALIVGLHMGLGGAFGLATPIFEAPDEANHFLFIRHLQIQHTLPVQTLDQDGPRAHHPPLYFLVAALASAGVPDAGGAERITLPENGDLWFRYGDPAVDHRAKFLHAPEEGWPWRGVTLAVHLLRALSTFFSALAVWFTYLAARNLRPSSQALPLLAAALLGLNPMVLFMSGVVQNSTAALASSAALLYGLSHWLRHGFSLARWAGLGVLFSATVLIQTSGLTLAAPVALALVYDAWRTRPFKRLIVNSLAFGLPVAALTGWWFVRNHILYGDWTANTIVAALWSDQPVMPLEQTWYLLTTGMVGRFGFGLTIEYPEVIYRLVWALALLAVGGLGWRALRQVKAFQLNDPTVLWLLHVVTIVAVAAGLGIYIVWYIRGGHGRYMFTAYPSIMIVMAAGVLTWLRPRWHALGLGLGLSLALALFGLVGLLIPAFRPPPPPTLADRQAMTPLDAQIGEAARVFGYRVSAEAVRPGQDLRISIGWQPLTRTSIPYTVFVQLVHPEAGLVAQQDTYPGQGNWATTIWAIDRAFIDSYWLHIPEISEPLEQAFIVVGLYDAATGERLPVTGGNAGSSADNWVWFGNVTIRP